LKTSGRPRGSISKARAALRQLQPDGMRPGRPTKKGGSLPVFSAIAVDEMPGLMADSESSPSSATDNRSGLRQTRSNRNETLANGSD